ncbi:hypothetical protein GOBAR_AA20961 [Gossypium barbadense]|uniref:Uncharacterized protein n=1 Tax=Gossypium barbadense TaxID=3634 RepID=A0A2P5X8Q2_GOSBA|nr:hypothetical protein GOBAR_AA20961 [Gossypium barbadense]
MKFLGWTWHKLQQSNIEPFKDFRIGNYCTCLSAYSSFNEQDSHPKSTSSCGYGSRYTTQRKQESENSTDFKAGEVDNFGDETSTDFLTIGTLASEWAIGEPVTPRFTMFLENITEGKTEVTENDFKVINDELEKFLGPEAEEHGSHESSGRNSLVSTIALNGEPTQEVSAEEYGKAIVCPLQGYLFGSSIELPETRFQVKKEKATLAELFYGTKIADESTMEKCGKEEMQTKQTSKPLKHFIKKILKMLHASSRSSISFTKETNPVSTKKKLQKVSLLSSGAGFSNNFIRILKEEDLNNVKIQWCIPAFENTYFVALILVKKSTIIKEYKEQKVTRLFHRKIHPESSIAERESKVQHKNEMNNTPYNDGDSTDGEQMHQVEVKNWFSQGSTSRAGTQNYKSSVMPQPQYGVTGCTAASSNGAHRIKTEADSI